MRDAPTICASSMSSLPWLGLTLIDGKPAASLAARAASRIGSGGKSSSVVYWSTAVHNCLSIRMLLQHAYNYLRLIRKNTFTARITSTPITRYKSIRLGCSRDSMPAMLTPSLLELSDLRGIWLELDDRL